MTPLQALKFSTKLNNGMGDKFIALYLEGKDVSDWRCITEPVRDTAEAQAKSQSFAEFAKLNPDEPERADGRKVHYGAGRQPLDDIVELGWGPMFCAGNVLKYLRRDKQLEDSKKKAKWYFDYLVKMTRNELPMIQLMPVALLQAKEVLDALLAIGTLTEDEIKFLEA
jgi:hypothetical protein